MLKPRSGLSDEAEVVITGRDGASETLSVKADPDAAISLRAPVNFSKAEVAAASDDEWATAIGPVADPSAVRVIVRFPAAGHPTIETIGVELGATAATHDGLGTRLVTFLKTWLGAHSASQTLGVSLVEIRRDLNAKFNGYSGLKFYWRNNSKTVRVAQLLNAGTADPLG